MVKALYRIGIAALLQWAAFSPPGAFGQVSEAEVRAVFVVKLASFIEQIGGETKGDSLVIAALGKDLTVDFIHALCATNASGEMYLSCYTADAARNIDSCDILYISAACENPVEAVRRAEINNCLTIGEEAVAKEAKLAVTLFTFEKKLRLRVNLDALERAQVRLSARVLKLAEIVRDADL
ncbi:MAG: YfiR family protein [bacterium]|nr:YfiR family protein [bacterium]